jgi:hypothetical protein
MDDIDWPDETPYEYAQRAAAAAAENRERDSRERAEYIKSITSGSTSRVYRVA